MLKKKAQEASVKSQDDAEKTTTETTTETKTNE